jgi:predicted amidohydrolase YtcJ
VIPDRPVILKDTSGHAQWLNTKALEVLGIDKNTPDPIPGLSYLYRDADGNPTGWILERAVDTQLKAAGIGDRISPDSLAAFLDSLAELGVTAVFDGGYSSGDYAYQAAAELERDGRMPLRYEGSYRVETADQLDSAAAELKRLREEFGGDRVKFNTIKVMFDGVSEIRTSAVLEPFLGEGGGRGKTLVDATRLSDFILELHAEQIDLHLHTVADRAIRVALDAVEMARAEVGGQERYDRMFRVQPLLDRNVAVTFSSDITDARRWRANRASPFFGMQIGHTRLEPEFGARATVRPPLDERLDLEDLVRGYTINGAAQLGMADEAGSIEVGKLGNLVVLDRNLFETLPNSISSIRPTAVLMEGELVSGSLATN